MSTSLPDSWRSEADVLDRRGAPNQAEVLRSCADELEAYERERNLELLTLDAAADATGYTRNALEKQIQRGDLRNYGKQGHPRVRRGELGRKPGHPDNDVDEWADELLVARLEAG